MVFDTAYAVSPIAPFGFPVVRSQAFFFKGPRNRLRVSAVDAKMIEARDRPPRTSGFMVIVALDRSRNVSRILPLRPNPSRSEKGGCFPAANRSDERRSERPQERWSPNARPSEMMDRIESDPALKLSCRP